MPCFKMGNRYDMTSALSNSLMIYAVIRGYHPVQLCRRQKRGLSTTIDLKMVTGVEVGTIRV